MASFLLNHTSEGNFPPGPIERAEAEKCCGSSRAPPPHGNQPPHSNAWRADRPTYGRAPSLPFSRGGRNFEAEFVSPYKVRRNAAVAAAVVAVCKRAGAVVIHADLAAAVARPTAHFLPAMHCNGYKVWHCVRETTFHMAETNNSSMRVWGYG